MMQNYELYEYIGNKNLFFPDKYIINVDNIPTIICKTLKNAKRELKNISIHLSFIYFNHYNTRCEFLKNDDGKYYEIFIYGIYKHYIMSHEILLHHLTISKTNSYIYIGENTWH